MPITDEHGTITQTLSKAGDLTELPGADLFGAPIDPAAESPSEDPYAQLGDRPLDYLGAHGRAGVLGDAQVHMGARVYDPGLGRFLSRDPYLGDRDAPQSQNAYAYGLNSPGRYYDTDGRMAWVEAIGAAGAFVAAGAGYIYYCGASEYCTIDFSEAADTSWSAAKDFVESTNESVSAAIGKQTKPGGGPNLNQNTKNPGGSGSSTSRGSTGRTQPENLKEQLAMEEVRSAPEQGLRLRVSMTDPRWPGTQGWEKFTQNVNGVEIHYVRNKLTGICDDFKFVD